MSLGASVWFTARGGTFAFYELPARAWEFGIGGLAVLLPRGILKLRSGWWAGFGWLGILAILGSAYFINGSADFPGWIALFPVLGTTLTLVAGAEQPHRGAGVVLDSAPLQMLGSLSYSWYLWHWPFLVFSKAILPSISVAGKTTVAAASLVVAGATHHFVENPIRFHPYLVKRATFSLLLAVALTFCSLSAANLSIRYAVRLANAPAMKPIMAAANDNNDLPRQPCVSAQDSQEFKTCVFGNASSATNIVLFGDSHALQWYPPLVRMSESHGWKLTTMLKLGCPATDFRITHYGAGIAAICASWRAEAIRRIVKLRPSLVLIANASIYTQQKDESANKPGVALDEWRDGTKRTVEGLTAAGLRVAVMRDNPNSTVNIPSCIARTLSHSWYPKDTCTMDKSEVLNPAVFEAEKAGVQGLPNVHLIDLTDQFCKGNVCWTVRNGMIMYRDQQHITGTFADSLTPVLEAELLPMLSK